MKALRGGDIRREGDFWDARWAEDHVPRADEAEKLAAFIMMLPGNLRLLDVGCGTGWMVEALKEKNEMVMGLDPSLAGLKWAPAAAGRVVGSGLFLPFRDGSFDGAICSEVLEHHPDGALEAAIGELSRISRRYVLVSVPYAENRELNMVRCDRCLRRFHSSLHLRSFREAELIELFSARGFWAIDLRKTGWIPYRSAWLSRLNASLTGYHPFWHPGLQCPFCGRRPLTRKRARAHPLSLLLELGNWLLGRLRRPGPRSLCLLLERIGR